jgi:hypothetical protein
MGGVVVQDTIDVEVAILNRCSDGVVEIRIKEGARITTDSILELLDAQQKLTQGIASVLVDVRGIVEMTRKALEITANNPVNDVTAATALLVSSPVSALLGNFFIRFGRPPYPAQVFRNEERARKWLLAKLVERTNA